MVTDIKKRKKRPPPKKKKKVVPTVAVSMSENATDNQEKVWLKSLLETEYVTSNVAISFDQLLERPRYKGKVALNTVKRWSSEGGWVAKRKKYLDDLTAGMRNKIFTAELEARMTELQEIADLIKKIDLKIDSGEAEPGTYEGLVGARIKAVKQKEELRGIITRDVMPETLNHIVGEPGKQVSPNLSPEEAHDAAMVILKRRQADAKKLAEKHKKGDG